jgi:hypothetical protein
VVFSSSTVKALTNILFVTAISLSVGLLSSAAFAEPSANPDDGTAPSDGQMTGQDGEVVDSTIPDDQLQVGDIVGEFTAKLDDDDSSVTQLGERQSMGNAKDCDELSDYYAYRQAKNEVQCSRVGGEGSCEYKCKEKRMYGCFSPETLVLMGDGKTSQRIDAIIQGDFVWNPVTKQPVRVSKVVQGPESKALFEIGYGPYRTHVTEKHPMVVQKSNTNLLHRTALRVENDSLNATVKSASEVTLDDLVLGADGEFHPVSVARQLPLKANQIVINIEVAGATEATHDHLIVADGVITGDYFVQKKLDTSK